MLDMLWKALDRALNMSHQAAALGDAGLRAFLLRSLRGESARVTFSVAPFRSIDAVGSELLARLLDQTDCDTHQWTPKNRPLNYLKFDF